MWLKEAGSMQAPRGHQLEPSHRRGRRGLTSCSLTIGPAVNQSRGTQVSGSAASIHSHWKLVGASCCRQRLRCLRQGLRRNTAINRLPWGPIKVGFTSELAVCAHVPPKPHGHGSKSAGELRSTWQANVRSEIGDLLRCITVLCIRPRVHFRVSLSCAAWGTVHLRRL